MAIWECKWPIKNKKLKEGVNNKENRTKEQLNLQCGRVLKTQKRKNIRKRKKKEK